jgi:hypothetical protein
LTPERRKEIQAAKRERMKQLVEKLSGLRHKRHLCFPNCSMVAETSVERMVNFGQFGKTAAKSIIEFSLSGRSFLVVLL